MKPIAATLLATALCAAFGGAYAETTTKPDPATYRTMTQKAAADYKDASAKCTSLTGNERKLCLEEAKVVRARAQLEAVTHTVKERAKARTALVNAEYGLAKAKCAASSGADKDSCLNNARSVHSAGLADAKADREVSVATTAVDNEGAVQTTSTRDATKAAAVEKCAEVAGQPTTGCLIDNQGRTATTAGTVAKRTENAVENVAGKTENLAARALDKTKAAAAAVAAKTERVVENLAAKTDRATDTAGAKTERAAEKTGTVVADSVITTKVKADIFNEPELKSMAIHVETEKGVVMLSGFVDSKADADKAVRLARGVEGVTSVKSAIKVK